MLLLACAYACKQPDPKQKRLLKNISGGYTLTLSSTDDKCGEWGGDESLVKIYRETRDGKLLADYTYMTKDCKSDTARKVTREHKKVELHDADIELIYACIDEITVNKFEKEMYISNSGISNRVLMGDIRYPEFLINDFSGGRWNNFELLVKRLTE